MPQQIEIYIKLLYYAFILNRKGYEMKYESGHDESYKGYDISVYAHQDNTCTVDLKYPCGELIAGWEGVKSFNMAINLAKNYANEIGEYKHDHCSDEYCTA